jgi:hypothetical protein
MVEFMGLLGYDRFAAQGGDWGASIASRLGFAHRDRLFGIHLNLLAGVRRDPQNLGEATPEEAAYREQLSAWLREETGYQWIQGTRPQTLAFGLTDSPIGLAAWIIEKFRAWSDCDARPVAGECQLLLVHRCDRLLVLALLRPPARAVADTGWANDRRADRLRGVPARDHPSAEIAGGAHVYRHPAVDRDAARWPFRRDGAARGAGRRNPRILPTRRQGDRIGGYLLRCKSPLLAQSGHSPSTHQCPLLGVKRTSTRSIRYWRLSSDLVKRCNGKTLTRSVALPWHGKTVAH